jgi:hypothetical protein
MSQPDLARRKIPDTDLFQRLGRPKVLVQLEGLGKSKTRMTSGIEPATFMLIGSALKIKPSNFLMLK